MKTKILTAEKLEQLKEVKKRLAELQQRSDERIAVLESMLINK